MRLFSPPQIQVESEGRKDQEISEELHKNAALEMPASDPRPVDGKCAFKRNEVHAHPLGGRAPLEDKKVQKKEDIKNKEDDT